MAGIFLSYGSPDAVAVLKLRDRLEALGITVWEYKDDMPAGANIPQTVLAAIESARLAVICFSDETADREWITRELAWCFQAAQHKKLEIVPVWVGSHPENRIPQLLAENSYSVFDLTSGNSALLSKLALEILEKLGDTPHVVPAALFSMTKTQCAELFAGWQEPGCQDDPAYQGLTSVCEILGMVDPPALFELLSQRYGERPEDLAPFQSGKPLTDSIYEVLWEINKGRKLRGKKPIVLRWVHNELNGEPAQGSWARDVWRARDSLLIVDSISAFHPAVQNRVRSVPDPLITRTAALWIPPYTQIMADLDETLGKAVRLFDPLDDLFRHLVDEPKRSIAFDTGTPMAFRLWLLRMMGSLPDDAAPFIDYVASMGSSMGSSPQSLSSLFKPAGRPG